MSVSALEQLCNPVFVLIGSFWQLSAIGGPLDQETVRAALTGALDEAKKKAARDPETEREYACIEKPLVFFIDYMIKEGRFSFRGEWAELSRQYSELSGDEKFFDLLSETLEDPGAKNSAALFYIMLGLGFDGAYRYNREYIGHCMRLCKEKARLSFNVYKEPLSPPSKKKPLFARRGRFTVYTALLAGAVFMLLCFIANLIVFMNATGGYRAILEKAAADSLPQTHLPAAETESP